MTYYDENGYQVDKKTQKIYEKLDVEDSIKDFKKYLLTNYKGQKLTLTEIMVIYRDRYADEKYNISIKLLGMRLRLHGLNYPKMAWVDGKAIRIIHIR